MLDRDDMNKKFNLFWKKIQSTIMMTMIDITVYIKIGIEELVGEWYEQHNQ